MEIFVESKSDVIPPVALAASGLADLNAKLQQLYSVPRKKKISLERGAPHHHQISGYHTQFYTK